MKTEKQILEKALIEGGRILKRAFYRPKKIRYKGPLNLVTETDRQAERAILEIIKKRFPRHSILAEESPPSSGGGAGKWIIDPLDGTTNFSHGVPLFSVSIAYQENEVTQLGGVWNPILEEWFWAERGKGASLNGRRIRVSKTKTLEESLLVTGFPYDRNKRAAYYLEIIKVFLMRTHGIRRLGSAALDTCYVASGRFDGYWEFGLHPWDVAAGALIAKEAGGSLTDFGGRPIDIYVPQTLVTNGLIHKKMLGLIQRLI